VLINVLDCIGYAKKNNIKGAVISIDMAKAFDTVSQRFLSECYKFFGLGPNFVNMLETVGKSRTACIIFDDGTLSKNFDLKSGRPQGENLSPIQYNICNQILLFKLELDPGIKSLFQAVYGPNAPFPLSCNSSQKNKYFLHESCRETDKAEGFADDSTALTLADQESISNIENCLINFEKISGLACNFEKSSITFIGDTTNLTNISTRFSVSESFKLLGVDISNDLSRLQDNFRKIKTKMLRSVSFWERLQLSLPGRIQICKTFLLSLVNYFGSILLPDPALIIEMQTIMNNFCLQNISFAKDRLYLPPERGGMGLIEISTSLIAQQCAWIKRASFSSRDNWRWDLWLSGHGNCFNAEPSGLDSQGKHILAGIVTSYRIFLNHFNNLESNILSSLIFNNPTITTANGFEYNLSLHFWQQSNPINVFELSKLKIMDFLQNGRLKELNTLNEEYNLNISVNTYIRLKKIFYEICKKFDFSKKTTDISSFFSGYKKGSKNCRNVFYAGKSFVNDLKNAFLATVPLDALDNDDFSASLRIWNLNSLPNSFREFCFNFYYNRIKVNTRLSHFSENSRWCTFCSIVGLGLGPFEDETFSHLFLGCPTTINIHSRIDNVLLDNPESSYNKRWLGFESNFFLKIFTLLVQYHIWEKKKQNCTPDANFCIGESIYILEEARRSSKKINNHFLSLNISLSRLWHQLARPRW
jgi:hypothetical protein